MLQGGRDAASPAACCRLPPDPGTELIPPQPGCSTLPPAGKPNNRGRKRASWGQQTGRGVPARPRPPSSSPASALFLIRVGARSLRHSGPGPTQRCRHRTAAFTTQPWRRPGAGAIRVLPCVGPWAPCCSCTSRAPAPCPWTVVLVPVPMHPGVCWSVCAVPEGPHGLCRVPRLLTLLTRLSFRYNE